MPLYEYKCAACGDVFEVIQKFSDEPLHEHPGCGGAVERLISTSALQFKGSGFYVNDYGRSNSDSRERSKSESSAAHSSNAKTADAKPTDAGKNGGSKAATTPAAASSKTPKADK